MMNRFFVLACGMFCIAASVSAQVNNAPDFSVASGNAALTVNFTASSQPFRLSIRGANLTFARNDKAGMTVKTADGSLVVRFAKTDEFVDLSKKLTDDEVLRAHRDWSNWMRAAEGTGRIKVAEETPETFTIADLRPVAEKQKTLHSIAWTAGPEGQMERVFYRTTLVGNIVVMVGAAFDRNDKISDARASTSQVIGSVTLLADSASAKVQDDDIDDFLEMAEDNGVTREDLKKRADEFKNETRSGGTAAATPVRTPSALTAGDAMARQIDIMKREAAYTERFEAFKKAYRDRFGTTAAIRMRLADGNKSYINGAELARFLAFKKETESFIAEYREHLSRSENILLAGGKLDAVAAANAAITRLTKNLDWLNGELAAYSSI